MYYRYFLLALLCTACSETSSTQRDYASARDDCREYSEARASLPSTEAKDQKTKLLALFADCMNKRGWSVSAPGTDKVAAAEKPKTEKPVIQKPGVISYYVPPMPMAQGANYGTDRASACAYARHAKGHSALAREVARDCDNECRNASTKAWLDACPPSMKKY